MRQALEELRASVSDVGGAVDTIAGVVSEQTAGLGHIYDLNRQIDSIAASTTARTESISAAIQEQLSLMEEIAASFETLQSYADRLEEAARKFRV